MAVTATPEWREVLGLALADERMRELRSFIRQREAQGATVFPAEEERFAAMAATPLGSVRAVILGQDPYHGGQAHGLSFSVRPGVRIPPSLRNIHKELAADTGAPIPTHGNLECWARQGVLLLNSVLTVERGKAGSHAGRGWEEFTDAVIAAVHEHTENTVFILWGAYAGAKAGAIDEKRHLVIRSPHPSPFSARKGFFGSRPFSRTNAYLASHGRDIIDWRIPEATP